MKVVVNCPLKKPPEPVAKVASCGSVRSETWIGFPLQRAGPSAVAVKHRPSSGAKTAPAMVSPRYWNATEQHHHGVAAVAAEEVAP